MRPEWNDRALDFDGYLERADMNVPTMRQNFLETRVKPQPDQFFRSLAARLPVNAVTVLCISESWCGDCVENLPVLARLARDYGFLRLCVFPRDTNLDIMDQYLTNGRRTIPVFVFYDQDMKEIGRFIERPPGAHEYMREGMERIERLPDKERQRAVYELRSQIRAEYKKRFRDETIEVIRGILERHYGRESA